MTEVLPFGCGSVDVLGQAIVRERTKELEVALARFVHASEDRAPFR